jgi:hypothetical protein
MSKDQIEAVLERVRSFPLPRQEDAARMLLAMESEAVGTYDLSGEERADLEAALEEIARGDLATEAEIETVFARHLA